MASNRIRVANVFFSSCFDGESNVRALGTKNKCRLTLTPRFHSIEALWLSFEKLSPPMRGGQRTKEGLCANGPDLSGP